MRLRVLGCYGAELSNHGTCGFLINRSVLVDGGTICSSLSLSEQRGIRYILISHVHADHIKGLPFLSENLIGQKGQKPIVVIGIGEVLAGLRQHLFNNQIWPDFTKLPNVRNPIFRMKTIREGERIKIDGLEVQAFRVNHTVPCSGFLIRQRNGSLLYSGDTYKTDKIWEIAAKAPDLKAAMIETSFPNRLKGLAVRSKHLTPALLLKEFSKIGKPRLPLFIYHMKPRYLDAIRRELKNLKIKKMIILKDGMVVDI
jgi:ribonuclease BN (tRNA processing enzyme)